MRAADPDNNTRSGASPSSTPPLHAEVRAAVSEIVENIHTMGMSDQLIGIKEHYYTRLLNERTDAILQAVAEAILSELPKRRTWENVQYGKDTVPEARTKAINRREAMAFNEALDAVTRVIGELRGY